MAEQTPRTRPDPQEDPDSWREDEPIPRAPDDVVLDETARLAREGRKELENDPRERPSKDS